MNSFGRGNDNKEKSKASVITRETVGMTLLLFGVIMFFIAVTSPYVFGDPGAAITSFFIGVFGYLFYPLDILMVYFGVTMVIGKNPVPAKWILRGLFLVLCVFFIVHIATAEKFYNGGYGSYLSGCWTAANEGVGNGTGGGVVLGIFAFPVRYLLTAAGAYVLFSLLTVLAVFLIAMLTPLKGRVKTLRNSRSRIYDVKTDGSRNYPAAEVGFDDLPEPSYRPVPSTPEPVQPAPIPQPAPVPVQLQPSPRSAKEESKNVLFRTDPASSYRNNLIFDHDSQFNTQPRRSSVVAQPAESEPATKTVKPNYTTNAYTYEAPKPDYPAPSYSERYSAQAETERPAMPRKVTPVERAYPADDYDCSQTPSYRAPSPHAPAEEKVNYYSHDVSSPYTQQDIKPSAQPAEPVKPAESVTTAAPDQPKETPARTAFAPDSIEPEPARNPFAPASVQPDPSAEEKSRDEIFRSIFSRPVERMRTEIKPEEPAERKTETADPAVGENRRFTESQEPRFGFGAELSKPAESKPGEESTDRFASRLSGGNTGRFDRAPGESADQFTPRLSEESAGRFNRASEDSDGTDVPARTSRADMFETDEPEIDDADYREETPELPARSRSFGEDGVRSSGLRERAFRGETSAAPVPDAPAPQIKKHIYKPYRRPSNDLFASYDDTVTVSQDEIEHNSSVIVETLAGFRVDAEVVKVRSGSAVTRYDIDIPKNIAVRTVIKRDAEIAMRLHARDGVNIYSNSEVGAISIEVPNSVRATVGLRSVLMADEYVNAKPNSLMFAIGKDIEGRNVCGNIVKMKHILVAGSTGSGKSVCLNAMLISLICRYSPADLRLILIDPKKVEFAIYDGLPHLMINEVIADANKAIAALNWAIKEMERRYNLFEQKTRGGVNVHNLDEYNASLTEDEEKLPKIVIVVDELADLMSVAKKDIEDRIQRLAQKARAAGMHLVIATQRPSVDVITGVIKGNLPTRLAFRVIQEVDSRTILDESGAEKLLGNGDMLYRTEGMFNCLRVQGAFLSSQEVQAVIEDIKANNEAYFDDSVADYINRGNQPESGASGFDGDGEDDSVDPQYIKALAIVVKLGSASISLIQRKCSVGYNHAGKIIEWMELMNYISPFDGKAKARTVLMSKEDFEGKYGSLDQW